MNTRYQSGTTVFQNWTITNRLGAGSFGEVYELQREDFGQLYQAALKVITVPQTPDEYQNVRDDGMSEQEAHRYFYSIVEDVVKEFAIMSQFKGNTNIVSYEDHEVVPHENGQGWDIIIRMELLTPLKTYTQHHAFTRRDIIRLGIDILKALEICQKYNVIHRDIKPENIFISQNGDFKLGDFGIARTIEKTSFGMSKKGTYTYMAPEVYCGGEYGFSVDTYSLGLVLYRLLNKNRAPFLPAAPEPITYTKLENALVSRISGMPIPKPYYAEGRLAEIVLKACAYAPENRYSSPKEMREGLEAILYTADEAEVIYPDGDEVSLPDNSYLTSSRNAVKVTASIDGTSATDSPFGRRVVQQSDSDRNDACAMQKHSTPDENYSSAVSAGAVAGVVQNNYPSWFSFLFERKLYIPLLIVIVLIAGAIILSVSNRTYSNGMTKDEAMAVFVQGQAYYESGEYEDAVEQLSRLPSDCPQYAEAQGVLIKARSSYRDEMLAKVDAHIQNENYTAAQDVLTDALTVMPGDEDLKEMVDNISRQEVLRTVDQYVQNGDEKTALAILDKALDSMPGDVVFENAYAQIETEYMQKVRINAVAEAAAFAATGEYGSAITALSSAKAVLADDVEIETLLDEYTKVFVDDAIARAEAVYVPYNIEALNAAEEIIADALKITSENSDLRSEADKYFSMRPLEISGLENAVELRRSNIMGQICDVGVFATLETATDNKGNIYSDVMYAKTFIGYGIYLDDGWDARESWLWCDKVIDLDFQYSRITGVLFQAEKYATATSRTKLEFIAYADEKVTTGEQAVTIWKDVVSGNTDPIYFDIDVTGRKYIRINFLGDMACGEPENPYHYAYIANWYLWP